MHFKLSHPASSSDFESKAVRDPNPILVYPTLLRSLPSDFSFFLLGPSNSHLTCVPFPISLWCSIIGCSFSPLVSLITRRTYEKSLLLNLVHLRQARRWEGACICRERGKRTMIILMGLCSFLSLPTHPSHLLIPIQTPFPSSMKMEEVFQNNARVVMMTAESYLALARALSDKEQFFDDRNMYVGEEPTPNSKDHMQIPVFVCMCVYVCMYVYVCI